MKLGANGFDCISINLFASRGLGGTLKKALKVLTAKTAKYKGHISARVPLVEETVSVA